LLGHSKLTLRLSLQQTYRCECANTSLDVRTFLNPPLFWSTLFRTSKGVSPFCEERVTIRKVFFGSTFSFLPRFIPHFFSSNVRIVALGLISVDLPEFFQTRSPIPHDLKMMWTAFAFVLFSFVVLVVLFFRLFSALQISGVPDIWYYVFLLGLFFGRLSVTLLRPLPPTVFQTVFLGFKPLSVPPLFVEPCPLSSFLVIVFSLPPWFFPPCLCGPGL